MKYQLGDKVLILHSQEEGEVVEIINDRMVLIDVEGVRFPVYMDQIDFPYFKRFSEKPRPGKKKEKIYIDDIKKEKAILESGNQSTGEKGLLQINTEIEKNKLERRSLESALIVSKFWTAGTILAIAGLCVFIYYLSVFFASAM